MKLVVGSCTKSGTAVEDSLPRHLDGEVLFASPRLSKCVLRAARGPTRAAIFEDLVLSRSSLW